MVFKRLLKWLAVRAGVDVLGEVGVERLTDELADREDDVDEALERVAVACGEDPDDVLWRPVETVQKLEDDPRTAYLWLLDDGVDPAGFADQLDRIFREQLGREPRGMHIPMAAVDDLRKADPDYVERQAAPWLQQAKDPEPEGSSTLERGEA